MTVCGVAREGKGVRANWGGDEREKWNYLLFNPQEVSRRWQPARTRFSEIANRHSQGLKYTLEYFSVL